MKFKRDTIILSTGKEVYANNMLVGIAIDGSDDFCEFAEGYDGGFWVYNVSTEESKNLALSPAEGIEICDAMLKVWKARKKALKRLSDGH